MFASNPLLILSLTLISGSYAAPEGICKMALEPLRTPITVVNVLPTKSILSPPNAQCLPEICPPGSMTTTTVYEKCTGVAVTYSLTVPGETAITGQPFEGLQDSENSPSPGEDGNPSSPGSQATEAVGNTHSGPNGNGGEGGGNASGTGQSSPSKIIGVSSGGSAVKGYVTSLFQISIFTAIFIGTIM